MERGLVPSREKAGALILAGEVVAKPGTLVREDAPIRLLAT